MPEEKREPLPYSNPLYRLSTTKGFRRSVKPEVVNGHCFFTNNQRSCASQERQKLTGYDSLAFSQDQLQKLRRPLIPPGWDKSVRFLRGSTFRHSRSCRNSSTRSALDSQRTSNCKYQQGHPQSDKMQSRGFLLHQSHTESSPR